MNKIKIFYPAMSSPKDFRNPYLVEKKKNSLNKKAYRIKIRQSSAINNFGPYF